MRRVDRTAVAIPDSLVPHRLGRGRQSKGALELARNIEALKAGKLKDVKFEAYRDDSVKVALHALFHGKCAYCESSYDATGPVDVEHFRPKGKVAGNPKHPGYWWLAAAWDNLLPSCIDCNRRRRQRVLGPDGSQKGGLVGKQDQFPLSTGYVSDSEADIGNEQPLLIDPCRDDPALHLTFLVENGSPLALVLPLDPPDTPQRGQTSILVLGLNRLALVQERTLVLRRLELLRAVLANLDDAAKLIETSADPSARGALASIELAVGRLLEDLGAMAAETEDYSEMVATWLRRWASDLVADN